MNKLWLVLRNEYVRRVKTRGFLFAVISMPLMILLAIILGVISYRMQTNMLPVGFVDHSGMFNQAPLPEEKLSFPFSQVEIIMFDNLESGKNALTSNSIQVLFEIQADYLESGAVEALAVTKPGENAYGRMREFLKSNLISGQPDPVIQRIEKGSNFTIKSSDGTRQANMRDWFVVLFPFVTGLIFIIVINISGGYLLQSVVDEKDNRTMEIIVTSVSPEQLMAGKILGNLSVGLTQLMIWLLFAGLGIAGVQLFFNYGLAPEIGLVHLVLTLGIIIPGFILIAALMTLVGVTATDMREAQQVSVLFTLPMVSPFWFASAILQHPDNPLTVFLSIFPFTSVVTMPLRISIAVVPGYQLVSAVSAMWVSAIFALLIASKAFRLGMLSYGKRIHLKDIFLKQERIKSHV
jgi:ABC-2 type transport system permease protein